MPVPPTPLWPGAAPLALGVAPHDVPTLTPFPSATAGPRSPALLVLPGGGYQNLAEHEGAGYAEFFAGYGIRTFVLKYRLNRHAYRHPAMLFDAARAIRYLRANATELQINPEQIGIIGSSAGGHLAATLMTKFDDGDPASADPIERVSSRPDLGILCYPVITFQGPFAQIETRDRLVGPEATEKVKALLSAEQQVTAQTPPCFIWHTVEDEIVPVENALLYASALRAAGVPFALHLYEKGLHGIGLKHHAWGTEAAHWLGERWPLSA
jgi:acetyl esterase/lipase